jgi:D-alanyl-D-alanine endopeptidase (penicillin-binding protein 7)
MNKQFKIIVQISHFSLALVLAVGFLLSSATVVVAAGSLEVSYDKAAFTAPATSNISEAQTPNNLPWQQTALTPAYNYTLFSSGLYDPSRPITLKIYYSSDNNNHKQIYAQDDISGLWRPLPTTEHPQDKYVSAQTDSIKGRVIVMADAAVMSTGKASWYKYKNGLFAASPDFPKGSVLRVYNLANGKSVDVTVNDYGPDRSLHPDRVIDLDYVAFGKIASTGAGLISVKVEPVKVVVAAVDQATPQLSATPNVTASSAIIIWEKTGEKIWGKDEDKVAPLASLTKLIAAKVFLDTKPDLKKVVTYKYQDEKYNYAYVKPWESARLTVKEGDTMTAGDLLYAALVGSANNAVESLVRASGLSRVKFIAAMNEAVKNWGAVGTSFVEPTGLSPQNVSSPVDYAIITKEVLSDPVLKKISTTLKYTFSTINTKKKHTLNNTNRLIKAGNYNITGSKTGYLEEAGHCLMTRVATPQGNIIAVNFGSSSTAANFRDNELLIKYGMSVLKNNP